MGTDLVEHRRTPIPLALDLARLGRQGLRFDELEPLLPQLCKRGAIDARKVLGTATSDSDSIARTISFSAAGKTSTARSMVLAALLVCRVRNTR